LPYCVAAGGAIPHKLMETENKSIEFKTLYNNTSVDFSFKYNGAPYSIKAGEAKQFVNYIADHGAKKLADVYAKTTNKNEKEVLKRAFLENVDFETMAKKMDIDLKKIQREALQKEKDGARVVNLETQVADLTEKLNAVLAAKKEVKEDLPKEEIKPKKVYKCEVCGEEFDMPIKLTNHIRSAHKDK